MKKYSSEYFGKKYHVLYNRLLIKDGFVDEIIKAREALGIPVESGFPDALRVVEYILEAMSDDEKRSCEFFAFVEGFEAKRGAPITEKNKKEIVDAFLKQVKDDPEPFPVVAFLHSRIDDHNNFIYKDKFLSGIKKIRKISRVIPQIFHKFMDIDLLDEGIILHFIESYLFLGQNGVHNYIKSKVACPNCKYIGVTHFSPSRYDMKGQRAGPFSGKYIFNESVVKRLSREFESVFIIIKPYATKEQVLQYVEDNWEYLKEHLISKNTFYKQFGVHAGAIKESNFERNRLVYELHKMPKKDLLKLYKGERDLSISGIYKEAVVSAILHEQYNIEMMADAVKKAAARFAWDTKLKKTPKDIGDI